MENLRSVPSTHAGWLSWSPVIPILLTRHPLPAFQGTAVAYTNPHTEAHIQI